MIVKALQTFADPVSPTGLRQKDDIFEIDENRLEYLNKIHGFDLVVAVVEKPAKSRKKRFSQSHSESISDHKADQSVEE